MTGRVQAEARQRRDARRDPARGVRRWSARPACARLGMRHYDVQLIGGMVLHRGTHRRDAHRRGQDPRRHAADATSTRSTGKGVHVVTVNDYLARRDAEWMGRLYDFLGLVDRRHRPRPRRLRAPAQLPLRHHLRPEQRVRLRLPARQHEVRRRTAWSSASSTTRSSTRSTRSSSTRRARRSSSPARPRSRPTSTSRSTSIDPAPQARRRLHRRREGPLGHAHRRRRRARSRSCSASTTSTTPTNIELLHHVNQALRAHTLYKRDVNYVVDRRQGHHRRRVHRPHDAGPPLVRRPAPGDRGQGGRHDRGREPDPRDDHVPELLPHVQEAVAA